MPEDDPGRLWQETWVGFERKNGVSSAILLVAIFGFAFGCSDDRRPPGTMTPRDGSVAADSGLEKDGGLSADANEVADSGDRPDGGDAPDAGDPPDGSLPDGSLPDGGLAPDGGDPPDAGEPSDGGDMPDGGIVADGGGPVDASAPDAGPSDGGPAMGACNNSADVAILQTVDAEGAAGMCGLSCIADPNRVMCSTDCVSMATGLSTPCSMCFAETIECTIMNCFADCLDPTDPACEQCQIASGCRAAFTACAGI